MVALSSTSSLTEIVGHASHLLPAQGPIGVFVHHNTLHAFQHKPFDEAICEAADIFRSEPYLTEEAFHHEVKRGRIRREDLEAVLAKEPDRGILPARLTRSELRLAMLLSGFTEPDPATLGWEIEEGKFSQFGQRETFSTLVERLLPLGISSGNTQRPPTLVPTGADEIHPLLIRLCSAFVDQGMSYWPMPVRELGFYAAAREIMKAPGCLETGHLRGLAREFQAQTERDLTAEQAVEYALRGLHVPESEWEHFIEEQLLALPGWAGMFNRLEQEPELAEHIPVRASLMDYLAVRLTLVLVSVRAAANAGNSVAPEAPAVSDTAQGTRLAAARLCCAATAVGLTAGEIDALPLHLIQALLDEVLLFDQLERRRTLHLAYERRHERQILLPLQAFRQSIALRKRRPRPAAQVFFCIDEREESTRRHLEEVDPEIETLGAAGFFGAAINYAGIDDGHSVSLCPVVVKPAHAVREKPVDGHDQVYLQRRATRRFLAGLMRSGRLSSRQLVRGWLATATLGVFSLFPLFVRVLSPRTYSRLRSRFNDMIVPRPETELSFTRVADDSIQGLASGFVVQEKADRVAAVLGGAGLVDNFAQLVLILGHGSTSINNPHESAYNCGACGGRRGGPNARLFAAMANLPEVRAELASRGIHIPEDTWFLGGHHDTGNSDIEIYDLKSMPATHRESFNRLRSSLDQTRALEAHERARRFEYCPRAASPVDALRHVQERTEHLAEPRPEYGHGSNAVCIIGRREITRGLFLDRRSFLVSYDATLDSENKYLAAQLGAAIPVCGGISLEYYFSTVDNEVYGCGTKLPHNIAGLIGVMNGTSGDLRTGLPRQTVEIHEPVRILFVVETTPERLIKVIDANPLLREFTRNEWIRLSTIDPQTGDIEIFRDGEFEPLTGEQPDIPEAVSSIQWYRGRMEHLPIARISKSSEAA